MAFKTSRIFNGDEFHLAGLFFTKEGAESFAKDFKVVQENINGPPIRTSTRVIEGAPNMKPRYATYVRFLDRKE
jgi:hypothetical protein